METLIAASNNKNKIRELKQILGDIFNVISLSEAGIESDPEETGTTFLENATIKAAAAAKLSGKACIADDSGLCVDALDGEPGVYSARYSGESASDANNNSKLLKKLADTENRNAHFSSAVVIAYPDGRTVSAEGKCFGVILREGRGNNGFGYDPLFLVPEYGKTFAELDGEIKNKISHRANALKALREKIIENKDTL